MTGAEDISFCYLKPSVSPETLNRCKKYEKQGENKKEQWHIAKNKIVKLSKSRLLIKHRDDYFSQSYCRFTDSEATAIENWRWIWRGNFGSQPINEKILSAAFPFQIFDDLQKIRCIFQSQQQSGLSKRIRSQDEKKTTIKLVISSGNQKGASLFSDWIEMEQKEKRRTKRTKCNLQILKKFSA